MHACSAFIFAQNGEVVLTSIYNLCFGAKMRKIGIYTCKPQFCLNPSFYTPGIYADGYIVFAFPFVRSYVR